VALFAYSPTSKWPSLALASAILLACGLTACTKPAAGNATAATGATQPPAAGAKLDCAVLTAAAASAVLHKTVTLVADTPELAEPGQSRCTYTDPQGAAVRTLVTVGANARQNYLGFKDAVTDPTPLPGIGDEAFDSEQGVGAIRGDRFVSVIGQTPGDDAGKQRLAKAVIDTL
jgi:hypothetical protein